MINDNGEEGMKFEMLEREREREDLMIIDVAVCIRAGIGPISYDNLHFSRLDFIFAF